MIDIESSRYKNLFFTYLISNQFSNGTVILLDGLPSNPLSKEKLMINLAEKNYDVFFPRYEGTWESKGEFLKRNPSEIILEFAKILKKGIKIKNKKYKAKKIFILGSSFGGGIALDIANQQDFVNKICVTSPVISFKKVKGIETLEDFLKSTNKENYRFNSRNWKKLTQDKMLKLERDKIRKPKNILIIIGNVDNQIIDKDIIEFGNKNKIKTSRYNSEHITLSKISPLMFKEIINFFS